MEVVNVEKFLELLVEVLDTETEFTMDTVLETIEEWDSLSIVSFAAMADIEYGKKIVASDIKKAQIVKDLYNLVAVE